MNSLKFPKFKHGRGGSCVKFVKKEHIRTASEAIPLVQLEGKPVIKAPKIYENQIFCDVYDSEGNHDRVLNTQNLNEFKPKLIFQWNFSDAAKDPENQKKNSENIIRIPGVHHRRYSKKVFN